ncbi:UDP-N-acetylmuramoyl-tripeptide--D-alanyl-D-alanine ligase [Jeongeupia chitinilytica]|uniref:UDP-N-acetylmuramoyl-tripeptide--D-alanyl-D-alanine ligase n=1 Tax=Jeongeupia chitinilytica TaxID=1041641 RepID=A0ABQ3H0X2_9NEIS|nr:UDP-N-acetylmuramoyl-tripeptide--D-alanyl-D-alanine ligase [Jeongeupia chitinilytica]GHD64811.1 UDP-N-acetylmuramoyl-tripeptide--D-alanyl-D-alanine ligase [Jeongeupia chitinilytica]
MMLTLHAAAQAVGGAVQGDATASFARVTTDSRDIREGDLFVALRGDRFDGHDFADAALAQGAAAVLVETGGTGNRIVVADTLAALGALASHWRDVIAPRLIAITGSNGKTSVKEMTAAILAAHAGADAVLATRGNLNNHIGVPLTLLGLRAQHRYAVVEMGMNHFGEIDYLTRMARPDVALVNNAGAAHLEALGSVEGVARAKGEIFAGLADGGTAVLNADDVYAPLWRSLAAGKPQTGFGLGAEADVRATDIIAGALDSRFVMATPAGNAVVQLGVPGVHNVRNALAATAAALALAVPLVICTAGLAAYHGVKGRLERKTAARGALLIDDSYNANPDSMKAAIDVLVRIGADQQRRTLLVLGDIGEVGDDAPARHAEVGAYAKTAGVQHLFTLGEHMREAAAAFGSRHFDTLDALLAALTPETGSDAAVLVKGSRFMRMERVVDALVNEQGND